MSFHSENTTCLAVYLGTYQAANVSHLHLARFSGRNYHRTAVPLFSGLKQSVFTHRCTTVCANTGNMTSDSSETAQRSNMEAWLPYLNDEVNNYELGTADREFPELFKALLSAGDADDLALKNYVRQFRELDDKPTLTYEPLVRHH